MKLLNLYLDVFNKGLDFKTRTSRREFWLFMLINFVVHLLLKIVETFFDLIALNDSIGELTLIYSIVMFIPILALSVRRLHDTNKTGWTIAINVIPIIGAIIVLYFYIKKGDEHENDYGPVPTVDDERVHDSQLIDDFEH